MATTTNEDINACLEAFDIIQEYPRNRSKESDEVIQGLIALLKSFNKDPKVACEILLKTVRLAKVYSFPKISAKIAKSLLVFFRHAWNTYSKVYHVPEHVTLSSKINAKAFGFLSKMKDSLRFLVSLDCNQVKAACSEVPLNSTGNDFFGYLAVEILDLKKQDHQETIEESETRYQAIIDHLDLYFNLATLREFVFLYIVILCIADGNSQNTAEGYYQVIEGQRIDMDCTLKILFKPEAEFAGVAAVFNNGDWPMLKLYTEEHLVSQRAFFMSISGKRMKIVSSEDDTFSIFQNPSEKLHIFKRNRYIRVSKEKHTEFIMRNEFYTTHFVISPFAERELTLNIEDSAKGMLVSNKEKPDENGNFNLVLVANGNVMLSCMKHPTRFVTMTSAKDDACLKTTNRGAGLNSQWNIINGAQKRAKWRDEHNEPQS